MRRRESDPPQDASRTGRQAGLTRREFVVTSLATGFAAAVLPVVANAVVTTRSAGLVAGEVKVPVAGGEMPAYRAYPSQGKGPFPLVLVVQEIFGVHEHIKDLCRRFAKEGHYAIAPALFARRGDPTTMSDPQEIVAKIVAK